MAPHRTIWSWYTGRWWVSCYIWYSEEETGWGLSPPRPLLAAPITVLLYNGPLLCGFNVPINGSSWVEFSAVGWVGQINWTPPQRVTLILHGPVDHPRTSDKLNLTPSSFPPLVKLSCNCDKHHHITYVSYIIIIINTATVQKSWNGT